MHLSFTSTPGDARTKKVSPLKVTLLALLLSISACKPARFQNGLGFYTRIQIEQDETMRPVGQRSLSQPTQLSFFGVFGGAYLASAEHLVRTSQSAPPHVAFYLEADLQNGRLDRTVKTTQLLQGDFGNISIKKTCFYHRSFDVNINTIAIGRYDGEAEPAEQVVVPPSMATKAPTSFALLRIYRAGDEAVVLTGNYEANGTLRSLHIDHTRAGARLFRPQDGIQMNPSSSLQMSSAPSPIGVGFPLTLKPPAPLESLRLPAAPLPVISDVLFTAYDDGALIREDMLAEAQDGTLTLKETRYLQPSVVDEQRQLEPACNVQLAKQRATQKRTVE